MEFIKNHRNPYKLKNNDNYIVLGFSELIRMDHTSARFRNILRDFKNLRKKYLNPDYAPCSQMENLSLIERELLKLHPDIFKGINGPEHLYYALRLIGRMHVTVRYRQALAVAVSDSSAQADRERNKTQAQNEIKNEQSRACTNGRTPIFQVSMMSTPTSMPTQRQTTFIPYNPPTAFEDTTSNRMVEVIDLTDIDDEKPCIGNFNGTTGPRDNSTSKNAPRANSGSATNDSANRDSSRVTGNRAAFASTSRAAEQPETPIHAFLRACNPPMLHYVQYFIEYGCATDAYLRAVSDWPEQRRKQLIREILKSVPEDARPTEMDFAILSYQFETYFLGK